MYVARLDRTFLHAEQELQRAEETIISTRGIASRYIAVQILAREQVEDVQTNVYGGYFRPPGAQPDVREDGELPGNVVQCGNVRSLPDYHEPSPRKGGVLRFQKGPVYEPNGPVEP